MLSSAPVPEAAQSSKIFFKVPSSRQRQKQSDYVMVGGIKGFETTKFATFEAAYTAIKPELEKLCASDALGQGVADAAKFDALFTSCDANGNATLTYTIFGNVTYDETELTRLLTMGRASSHYSNGRHLINFKFVGGSNDKTKDTLTVNSNITLPYEWWGEKTTTSISFENLTITGSAPNGLYPYQSFFEGINFTVDKCTLKGIKIYNCSNVGGSYTITNSTLDGTAAAANAYAIHLQGNETAPLRINISGNTISGYDRGVNIDRKTANATISGNTIAVKDTNRSCIQLTQLAETAITGNTLNLTGGNAFTLHEGLLGLSTAPTISITGNTINGNGYLIYDDAVANNKEFTSENLTLNYGTNTFGSTVDTTKGVKEEKQFALSGSVSAVVNGSAAPSGVAAIGSTGYPTLAAAFDAAQDGATVTLLADVTEDVTINKSITLDLGGKTLIGKGTASTAKLTIAKGATATVKNGTVKGTANAYYNIQNNGTATFEDVTATAGNTGSSMLDNWGTLTIESGTYTGGLDTVKNEEDATLTINGGTFTLGEAKGTFTAVVLNWGSLTITDGTFIQSATTGQSYYAPQVIHTDRDSNGTKEPSTIITGGVFKNYWNKSQCWTIRETTSAAGATKVSGGDFNKELQTSYIVGGSYLTKNSDGTFGIAKGECEAMVGKVGYPTLEEALEAVTFGGTVKLVKDVTVEERLEITKRMTLDLGSYTLTSTYAMGDASREARYALTNKWALTIKNGTFAAGEARAIGAYYKLTLDNVTVTQKLTDGNACVAFCKDKQTYEIKNSTIDGAYAVCNFANNATITISDSKLSGTGNTLYHNGTNYGLKLTVTNTTITSTGSCGVYISGSTSAQSNEANQNGVGGHQQATFTGCTISGTNGVEVKYTDLTLDGCTVEATVKTPSYTQNNNGPAGEGFAVVATDNAKDGVTPVPTGTSTAGSWRDCKSNSRKPIVR